MKKICISLIFSFMLAVCVQYSYCGYAGPSVETTTVKQALKLTDDTPVVLVGKIVKALGGEMYLFADETGTVTVEIDDDKWLGLTVDENDIVEISGKVDKDRKLFKLDLKIDVDRIVKK